MRPSIKSLVVICLFFPFISFAQIDTAPAAKVQSLVKAIKSFNERMPAEKIFLHIDKPYYSNIDTIWIKAYVLNDRLQYSPQSSILYTELVNDTGQVMIQQAVQVVAGIGISQIALDAKNIFEGNYTLRAYTNWMQNLGNSSFFSRRIFISNADEASWLVKADSKTTNDKKGKPVTEMALQITDQQSTPIRLREMELRLTQGAKIYRRQKMQTDIDGRLTFSFDKPGNADNNRLNIIAQDIRKGAGGKRLVIPVNLQPGANTDVQFMPESGQLVNGITTTVGFKAIGEDGKGVNIKGSLLNSKGEVVTDFESGYKGIGSFILNPVPGETYSAKVTLPDGSIKNYPLPDVKTEGLVLRVSNVSRGSSAISIQGSAKFVNNKYSLICMAGNDICYAAQVDLTPEGVNGRLLTDKFPQGIIRFLLFTQKNEPVAERLVYIDHHQRLNINAKGNKPASQPAGSVSLDITVTDKNNKPVVGSLSLAVTNDAQVKADSIDVAGIDSYMLLSSNLKGYIEDPGYYFCDTTRQTEQALDNLLLTQGWVGYSWDKILSSKQQPPKFPPEKEPGVAGTILRSGKPQANVPVLLISSKKTFTIRDTVTDANGRFLFNNLPMFDTITYRIEAQDKKGKISYLYDIKIDEFSQPDNKAIYPSALTPWYVNSDNTLLDYNKQNIARRKMVDKSDLENTAGVSLQQVVISATKVIPGSKNLNGPGEADQILDEKDLRGLTRTSILNMLEKKVRGFSPFKIDRWPLKFIIDGISVDFYYDPIAYPSYFEFVKETLFSIDPANVKGIEVLYSNRFLLKYSNLYNPGYSDVAPIDRPVYIEITTYSGQGMSNRKSAGVNMYQPMALTPIKAFYQPKYTVANAGIAGMRPTIYWDPFIITDKKGKANVSFNAGVKPGTYTYILQGTNIGGLAGSLRGKLVIK